MILNEAWLRFLVTFTLFELDSNSGYCKTIPQSPRANDKEYLASIQEIENFLIPKYFSSYYVGFCLFMMRLKWGSFDSLGHFVVGITVRFFQMQTFSNRSRLFSIPRSFNCIGSYVAFSLTRGNRVINVRNGTTVEIDQHFHPRAGRTSDQVFWCPDTGGSVYRALGTSISQ